MSLLTLTEFLLPAMVFAGAALQIAGGLGFGVVAGPALVACLGPTSGIQASIILNIGVAIFGWLAGRKDVRYDAIRPMVPGILIGTLSGLTATLLTPEWLIKIVMCGSLGWICLLPHIRQNPCPPEAKETFKFSVTSGIMGGALAIPGPAAAVYLRKVITSPKALRNSMMPLLTFAYILTGFILFTSQGITEEALSTSFKTFPAAIAGLITGTLIVTRISEATLERVTQVILLATFTSLAIITTGDIAVLL